MYLPLTHHSPTTHSPLTHHSPTTHPPLTHHSLTTHPQLTHHPLTTDCQQTNGQSVGHLNSVQTDERVASLSPPTGGSCALVMAVIQFPTCVAHRNSPPSACPDSGIGFKRVDFEGAKFGADSVPTHYSSCTKSVLTHCYLSTCSVLA